VVLDARLNVVVASRAFYETFKVDRAQTQGRSLYSLGDGQWNTLLKFTNEITNLIKE